MGKINKSLEPMVRFVKKNPGSLTINEIAEKFKLTRDQVSAKLRRVNSDPKGSFLLEVKPDVKTRLEIKPSQRSKIPKKKIPNTRNVMVIGDLHEPFCLESYLAFAKETYKKYDITHVIFIGDIIDNHFASYHETDPDGFSARDELEMAVKQIAKWVEAFPVADVVIGNHDRLIARKALSGGISGLWLREYNDVLGAPNWDFQEEFVYDNVQYLHGEGGTARTRSKNDKFSTVQGHLHTQAYLEYSVGRDFRVFGMQVGCGINWKTFAMTYGKNFKKPAIGMGLVLEHGKLPINIMADL